MGCIIELRERYPELRTQQIIYALYKDKLVRIIAKGSALGSEAKSKDVNSFYEYIASFDKNSNARDGVKDHFYDFKTNLASLEEIGNLGGYYTITFVRGEPNTDEEMKTVAAYMKSVHEFVVESDEYYAERVGKPIEETSEDVINYGDDEAQPDIDDDAFAEG